jgi:GNAT superfamily N-acetyltransferase
MISVRPVGSPREKRLFLTFPWRILRGDPLWVPPLLPDLVERTDPRRGNFFRRGGEAEFFIAWRGGDPVGTICAAVDHQNNRDRGVRECIFGFFHFIEEYAVMEALLGTARQWAADRGMQTLAGPFHLDYEDSYGILVEGRDRPPALMCGHTPPYYLDCVERYGFQPLRGDNLAYAVDLCPGSPAMETLSRMAGRVRARKNFTIRPADMDHWQEELERIYVLLNLCLRHLPDFRPWQREVVFDSLTPFRKIADPELILFAQDGDQVVGWLPGLPNLNEAFIHANGLRRPWDYLTLLWYLRKKTRCLTVKSVLVLPEYWGSGLAILLFDEMAKRAAARGYQWIDGSLTSADNPRTPAVADHLGAKLYKRYRVYQMRLADPS